MRLPIRKLLWHTAAASLALLFVLPLYWGFIVSISPTGVPPAASVSWWPERWQWENYRTIFDIVPLGRHIWNSLYVVMFAVPLTLLTASLAGFGMAQLPAGSRRRWIRFTAAILIIPAAAVWLFRFQILSWLGLLSSRWALILPAFAASSPLYVLLFYWAFRRVQTELWEASLLDGASAIKQWWLIGLPLVEPTTVAVTVLSFVMYWSDFISPVLYIFDPTNYTLPVGVQLLNQLDATNYPLLMAGSMLMTLPVLILFIFLQRAFLGNQSLSTLLKRPI